MYKNPLQATSIIACTLCSPLFFLLTSLFLLKKKEGKRRRGKEGKRGKEEKKENKRKRREREERGEEGGKRRERGEGRKRVILATKKGLLKIN